MTWGSLAPPLGNTRLHVVKLLASALSTNAAALTQELLVLDVPNTLLVQGLDGIRGQGDGDVGRTLLISAYVTTPSGPLLPLCIQQLPACSSGGVCERHAEFRAPLRQQLRDTCPKPYCETCKLGVLFPSLWTWCLRT